MESRANKKLYKYETKITEKTGKKIEPNELGPNFWSRFFLNKGNCIYMHMFFGGIIYKKTENVFLITFVIAFYF